MLLLLSCKRFDQLDYSLRLSLDYHNLPCVEKTPVTSRKGDGLYISAPHLGHGVPTRKQPVQLFTGHPIIEQKYKCM